MHETSQQQRVNNSMSIDSSSLGSSKFSVKKTPFYKHDDPSKLNYYARFSPKRKIMNQQFQEDLLEGGSPLSPRTSKASSSQKQSLKSSRRKVFKDQAEQTSKNKFELIDPNILISVNDMHQNRGQIYIDDDDESFQDNQGNQKFQSDQKPQISNNFYEPRFNNPKNILDIPIYQNPKESSQSQESSSFERMVQQSSSQDNDIPYVLNLKTSGGEMLIEDDQDSEPETVKSPKRFKVQSPMKILDGSQQKILELAKSIGACKMSQTQKKQVKSQNISFSVDSDLSQMEQKWNSYFQSSLENESFQNQESKNQIFSENLLQQRKINHKRHEKFDQNERKMSQSSQEQLPSFSHPNTSSYHITPLQSQRSSTCSQDAYNMIDFQGNSQAKQFKRQFTFGNQLNVAFQTHMSQKQLNAESKQPLFKKFLQKSTLQNFKNKNSQKKQKQATNTNQGKKTTLNEAKKSINAEKKPVRKSLILDSKSKINEPQIVSSIPQSPKISQKIHDQKNLQQPQSYQSQSKKGTQILIIQQQSDDQENMKNFQNKKVVTQQLTQKQNPTQSQVKKLQKLQKKLKWQQTLRSSNENQKDTIYKSQKQHQTRKVSGQQIKIDDPQQSEQQVQPTGDKRKENTQKVVKTIQPNSYSKIFSEKRFYRMRKGSYKISQSQYHSSQEEQNSQKDNKYSQQKSQGGESLTTATQEVNQNSKISPHYFFKNRSNCIEEVQNLKKYLQKIQNSPLSDKEKGTKKGTFDFNENFQSYQNQKDSNNQSFQSSYFDKSQHVNVREKQQDFINPSSKDTKLNNVLPQSYQQKNEDDVKSDQQKQTPIKKLLHKESQVKSPKEEQERLKINNHKNEGLENYRGFQKSLTMLQQLIPNQSHEISRIYEKIYTQVYQQQLRYQQKLQKQEFLINLMEDFLYAENEKIDCENYLTQQIETDIINKSAVQIPSQVSKDQDEKQIFINKHLILALVRNLARS